MKKLLSLLLALLMFTLPAAAMGETVVTSFYPIYLVCAESDAGSGGVGGTESGRAHHGLSA